jgi:hypothetical protein
MTELMQFVVFHGRTLDYAFSEVPVDVADLAALRVIAHTESNTTARFTTSREARRRDGLTLGGPGDRPGTLHPLAACLAINARPTHLNEAVQA